ncbi:MAG: hydantoinase/oxoprolinase family protein [Rubellimicrobium sp.]|nr:hydantoinase/oxoprolinase family protein [Rubellimicrobium sp.]
MRVATDVGGTFTDIVVFDETAARPEDVIRVAKVDSTPPDFETGVLNAIRKAGADPSCFVHFVHGSTVIINALLSRRGAKTGLVTTAGFRDVLEIARGNRPDLFNFNFRKPPPFIPRRLRLEITERIDYRGAVVIPLALEEVDALVDVFRQEDVGAVAVCFLHAYANPDHEKRVVERIRALAPGLSVLASHEITREWREYERTSTTVLSAYIHPVANRYLALLEQKLSAAGLPGRPNIMQSNGGIATIQTAAANPICMIESGPASGMLGAVALGKALGEPNLIGLDVGGTTAKCSLIESYTPNVTSAYVIERTRISPGYPIRTPVIDIVEIGSGGGSIAWLDEGGKLHVGPESAGASPGPVAYGRGGTQPTTTDAHLMIGRIHADSFLGGEVIPAMDAVRAAFAELGESLGVDAHEAARGVVRIANADMVKALKLVSINRGYDPRDFKLVAFGGGGAMHAVALANELRIPEIIVPTNAAVFSAWGMLMSDLRRDYVRTRVIRLDAADAAEFDDVFAEMVATAASDFRDDGVSEDRVVIERWADFRYKGQEHTVKVALPGGAVTAAAVADWTDRFHTEHDRAYSFRLVAPVEIVNFHVSGRGLVAAPQIPRIAPAPEGEEPQADATRQVDFDEGGIHSARIYARHRLAAGHVLVGPAVVEEPATTLIVPPGWRARVDEFGNLRVTRSAATPEGATPG